MPFLNCQLGGTNLAFPDVCKTPSPVGPVPIPYPNNSMPCTGIPFCPKMLVTGGPAHNMLTMAPISAGDNSGVAMGVASSMVMGPTRHLRGSTAVLIQGAPATRLLDTTGQNGATPNAVGATLVPAQVKVCILR